MDRQTPEKKERTNWKFAFLFLILLVMALLVMEFNSRLNDLYRLENEREVVSVRMEEQQATRVALQTAIFEASLDRAVEEYARERGKMKQKGDHPLIIVPGEAITPTPQPSPTPLIQEESNPQRWFDLLFKPLR